MKAFIGSKIIRAEKMYRNEFNALYRPNNEQSQVNEPGYHVAYPNPDYTIYHSWSPQHVFERAYREVTQDEYSMITQIDAAPQPENTTSNVATRLSD